MSTNQVPSNTPEPRSDRYSGYAGLPPLVGLQTMSEAITKGLSVKESVDRLKRLHWSLKRLHRIFTGRVAATPIYELKMAFSLHAHYCAEHVAALADRVHEMRQPPLGLDISPHASLDLFFDEIESASDLPALLLGLYECAIPSVVDAIDRLLADTNKLFDHPTFRICRFALIEMRDIADYGAEALRSLVPAEQRASLVPWLSALQEMLAAAGRLDGTHAPSGVVVERLFSRQPFRYDGVPRRDERFQDSYNMGVNAEAFLFDPAIDPLPKSIMLYFKRLREIDVPEVMSSIITETTGKPWAYYRDMTRQMWDEARHAMMGEIGFTSLDIDWRRIPVNFTWSLGLNQKLTPIERHAVLYTIEQGLMPKKNGKEYEWQVALATASRLSAIVQDYDWADEVLHARIGREWLVPDLGSQIKALAYGDEAWTRVTEDWTKWRDEGLTEHRNWWPEIYRAACQHWGVQPDPALLAYHTTYQSSRADMKSISG